MLKVPTAVIALCGALVLSLAPAGRSAEKSAGFKVIVNASNPVTSLSLTDVSQLFLKRTTRWSGGSTVVPVDLPAASAVREEFSRQVLGRPTFAVEAYWHKLIFSGQAVPPLTKASAPEVVAYVRENAGAIGYVSTDTPLEGGVKVLTLTGNR